MGVRVTCLPRAGRGRIMRLWVLGDDSDASVEYIPSPRGSTPRAGPRSAIAAPSVRCSDRMKDLHMLKTMVNAGLCLLLGMACASPAAPPDDPEYYDPAL